MSFQFWGFSYKSEVKTVDCNYHGVYIIIQVKTESSDRTSNSAGNDGNDNPDTQKFLLHDGFQYEFKIFD